MEKKLNRIAALIGVASTCVGVAAATVACSSGAPSAPPTAASVLHSNGYNVITNETPAQISSTFGSSASDISSAAAGSNSAGNIEVAVVLNSQGQADLQGAQSELQQEVSSSPGLTLSVNGAVLTVSGSTSAFTNSSLGQ